MRHRYIDIAEIERMQSLPPVAFRPGAESYHLPAYRVPRCEYCGKTKDDVKWRKEPYEEDVNDNIVYYFLCDQCTHDIGIEI